MTTPKTNVARTFWEAPASDDPELIVTGPALTQAEFEGISTPSPNEEKDDNFNRDAYDLIRWGGPRR